MRTIEFNYSRSRLVVIDNPNSRLAHTWYYDIELCILSLDRQHPTEPTQEWSFTVDTPIKCVSQSEDGEYLAILSNDRVTVYQINGGSQTEKYVCEIAIY